MREIYKRKQFPGMGVPAAQQNKTNGQAQRNKIHSFPI